jgi:hypothetical protein
MANPGARLAQVSSLALLIFGARVDAADPGVAPWAFVNGAGEGYSVQLVSAVPAPGTEIFAGQTLEFKVTIAYRLSMADTGSVVLVVQDENNRSLGGNQPQQTRSVERGEGEVTLTQTFVVPTDVHEVRLFVPLVPKDVVHTSGELILRYPVGHEARSAYPAVVRRAAVQTATGVNMNMDVLCEASKSACDQLMLDFQALNQRVQGSFQSK